MKIKDNDYEFLAVPVALAGPPSGFVQVHSRRWWSVCPKRGLRFYNPVRSNGVRVSRSFGAPQCNLNKSIMERLRYEGDEIVYFERVFIPINIADWT